VNFAQPSPQARIYIANDLYFPNPPPYTTDRYGVSIINGVGGNSNALYFQMDDTTYSALNSDALPLVQPNPSAFNFFYGSLESNGFFAPAEIRFVLTDVPEPTTIGVLLLLPALAARRRRHQG
jgi:hypothetical protein